MRQHPALEIDPGIEYGTPTRNAVAWLSAGLLTAPVRVGQSTRAADHSSPELRTLAMRSARVGDTWLCRVTHAVDGAEHDVASLSVGDVGVAVPVPAGIVRVEARCTFASAGGAAQLATIVAQGLPREWSTATLPVYVAAPVVLSVPPWAYEVTITAPTTAVVTVTIGLAQHTVQTDTALTLPLPLLGTNAVSIIAAAPFTQIGVTWRHRR